MPPSSRPWDELDGDPLKHVANILQSNCIGVSGSKDITSGIRFRIASCKTLEQTRRNLAVQQHPKIFVNSGIPICRSRRRAVLRLGVVCGQEYHGRVPLIFQKRTNNISTKISLELMFHSALKREGGVRGIAIGTSFRRSVTLARQFMDQVEETCSPFQFARIASPHAGLPEGERVACWQELPFHCKCMASSLQPRVPTCCG